MGNEGHIWLVILVLYVVLPIVVVIIGIGMFTKHLRTLIKRWRG